MENIAQSKRHRCGFLLIGDITGRFVAYKLTNMVNGKSYIGISKLGLWRRLSEHAHACVNRDLHYPLYAAFRKYGIEAFSAEVLSREETPVALLALECALIAEHGTYDKARGYNATLGGQGTFGKFHSPETLAKIHAKAHSPESTAARIAKITGRDRPDVAGVNNPSHRADVKRKIVEALTGRASPWTGERNRTNRKLTEEQVRAILLDPRTPAEISADYGISRPHICNIMKGNSYSEWVAVARAEFGDRIIDRKEAERQRGRPHMRGDNHPWRRNPELVRQHSEKLKGRKAPETSEANKRRRSLTEDDIRMILTDPRTCVAIGAAIGKSKGLIRDIRAGKKYADVVQKIRLELGDAVNR